MWTNKDITKVGKLAKKETLEKLIPGFKNKGEIVPYQERIKKQREEQVTNKDKLAGNLLLKALQYYKDNFKKLTIVIDIKKSLDENFNTFTESQLFEIQNVLDFCHLPTDFGHPEISRLIVSIPDHDLMKLISAKIKSRIPAFKERLELLRLEVQETELEKRKRELKTTITKTQRDFKKKVESKEIVEKEVETEIEDDGPKFPCPVCGKKMKSPAGVASHVRSMHPEKEKKPEAIQLSDSLTLE